MTATLCGILVEQKKLRWDMTLAEAMPSPAKELPLAFQSVTLEQLLCHSAGLPDDHRPDFTIWPQIMTLRGDLPGQRVQFIRLSLRNEPTYPPGTDYAYANAGFVVAGAMCEAVTGRSYEELMKEFLFDPLGMDSAGFGAPGIPGKQDQPWGHSNLIGMYSAIEPGVAADNPAVIAPAGTVHASIGDWAKYVALHLDAACGRPRIMSPETWKRLHSDPFGHGYGFGWVHRELDWAGGMTLVHDGSNGHWYAIAVVIPHQDRALLVVTNAADSAAEDACRLALKRLSSVTGTEDH
jgi:CubicO group peptidase (beta-lactamase class C family)